MRGYRFAAALAAVSLVLVASPARAQDALTETGFVAAVGEGTVLVSNVPLGQGGGRMMLIQREGAPPPPPPAVAVAPASPGEARTGADARSEARGGSAPPTFVARKADEKEAGGVKPGEAAGDGKVITLSRQDAEKLKGTWAQADPDAKPAPRTEGADEKVAFTEFQVTPGTERPADLAPGTKVRITYTVEGAKKVATKIEIAKE